MVDFATLREQLKNWYPPKPTLTENNLPDQQGKVFIITGPTSGVGKELARLLFSKNANVYVAARSAEKAAKTIDELKASAPDSTGSLIFLHLDLADLRTIKPAALEFLSKESKLDVLFNNAGIMDLQNDATTPQGLEMNIGINCVGHQLFTELLTPVLAQTARAALPNTVRVVWVCSEGTNVGSPKGGVDMDKVDFDKKIDGGMFRYAMSKAGNYLQAVEYAKRHKSDGIVSIPMNPGDLKTDLYEQHGPTFNWIVGRLILKPTIYGTYTELWAGLSPKVTLEKSGAWAGPWGRWCRIRPDVFESTKTKGEGGTGVGRQFWEWSEDKYKAFR